MSEPSSIDAIIQYLTTRFPDAKITGPESTNVQGGKFGSAVDERIHRMLNNSNVFEGLGPDELAVETYNTRVDDLNKGVGGPRDGTQRINDTITVDNVNARLVEPDTKFKDQLRRVNGRVALTPEQFERAMTGALQDRLPRPY